MKKALFIAFIVAYLVGVPVLFSSVSAKAPKKPIKPVVKVVKKNSNKFVLGAAISGFFNPGLINCAMPDGKTIKASKKDCDSVNVFWASHRPSNPGNSNGGGGGSSSGGGGNSGGGYDSKPTFSVTSVIVHACTSSSCNFITTIEVNGLGFTGNTRAALIGSSATGNYVGGNASTKIITDFYNVLPGTYDLKVYSLNGDTQEHVIPGAVVIH